MPNQWTRANQMGWEAQQVEGDEEEEEKHEPSVKMVIVGNHDQKGFSVKDIVIAMIGVGWKDIDSLHNELRTIGFDFVIMLDKETLAHILEELEEDEFVEVYWDTERVRRLEQG